MKITLINPPHTAIGSRIPDEHLPPLGLLSVGGPLVEIARQVQLLDTNVVMIGHSGSSTAHPTIVELSRLLKLAMPELTIVYGGVHPTYHWDEILRECADIDIIVRGEGEETALRLMHTLESGDDLDELQGIAFRRDGEVVATPPAMMIRDLDAYRIGWELIDFSRYSYWGGKRTWHHFDGNVRRGLQ
ncbi:MAG TPA: cobalamin-dependent protein [Steroidobacter sp.]